MYNLYKAESGLEKRKTFHHLTRSGELSSGRVVKNGGVRKTQIC